MTDPKLIEAVARALCKINGHDPDWPASHFSDHKLWTKNAEDAQTIITAYEAARGDVGGGQPSASASVARSSASAEAAPARDNPPAP